MSPDIIIAGLIIVPVVLLFVLRINAALAFLSLCLGSVLVQFTGSTAITVLAGAGRGLNSMTTNVHLSLLALPFIITTVCMIRTVKTSMKYFNILPAIATGFLLALLVVPLLSPSLSRQVVDSGIWTQIQSVQSAIVAGGAAICLLFLLLQRPKHHEEKAGKHKD